MHTSGTSRYLRATSYSRGPHTMTTKSSRYPLIAMIFAALNFGAVGCSVGATDDPMVSSGILPHVGASEETRSATGISSWSVMPIGDQTLVVAGLDGSSQQVTAFMLRVTEDDFSIEGDEGRRLEMTTAGEAMEN